MTGNSVDHIKLLMQSYRGRIFLHLNIHCQYYYSKLFVADAISRRHFKMHFFLASNLPPETHNYKPCTCTLYHSVVHQLFALSFCTWDRGIMEIFTFPSTKLWYMPCSQEKIRKRRLFKKVQAFCEEKVLRCLLGVFWYAESKNQCWQAEKWHLYYLICIFPRWPPNWRNSIKISRVMC